VFGHSSLNQFIQEVIRYPLLSPEQELILFRQIESMNDVLNQSKPYTKEQQKTIKIGQRAKNKFITSNLRMVINIAKKYNHKTNHLELSDLIGEGIVGLIRAVEKYDGSRGYRFSTYAYWWIRQAISRSITTQERSIRLPVNVEDDIIKFKKISNQLCMKLGRFPSNEEIAKELKCSPSSIDRLQNVTLSVASLDTTIDSNGESQTTLLDLVADQHYENPYDYLNTCMTIEQIQSALKILNHKEEYIVNRRYGLNGCDKMSILDISRQMNLSRDAVRKTLSSAHAKIRFQLKDFSSLTNSQLSLSY
jgi:RNA polymerase primary sigma factor